MLLVMLDLTNDWYESSRCSEFRKPQMGIELYRSVHSAESEADTESESEHADESTMSLMSSEGVWWKTGCIMWWFM